MSEDAEGPAPEGRGLGGPRSTAWRRAVVVVLLRTLLAVLVLLGLYYLVPEPAAGGSGIVVRVTLAAVLCVVVASWQLRSISRSDGPLLRAVEALAVVATLAVVLFAAIYVMMSRRDVTAFSEPLGRTAALYFTLTTLTTVGYGDIAARSDAARIVVMFQMVFNVAVIGAAIKLMLGTARLRERQKRRG